MEAMAVKINKDTKVDTMHIKAFVSFALSDESRYVSALEYIKTFSASALSTSCMVYLANFAEKSGLQSEMQEISKIWGITDANLETAFNNCINIEDTNGNIKYISRK